jgi:hypothetical protein
MRAAGGQHVRLALPSLLFCNILPMYALARHWVRGTGFAAPLQLEADLLSDAGAQVGSGCSRSVQRVLQQQRVMVTSFTPRRRS